ncbi:hypothetical protein AVEN_93462-1 [Araneus ventricosus]|uniref:Uncharacterized protein n=1 Tax=Araneus ventricosus TaxID=182803 RepID=A0A4Y2AQ87_ARAVE|nr:hypothetical protein AVEN_93462-1 [Araneus ventricosus]
MPKHSGSIGKRSPRQHLETGVGVLTAIIGHGPTPPEGGKFRHRSEGKSNLHYHYYYTPRRSENPLTDRTAAHPRTRGAPHVTCLYSNAICGTFNIQHLLSWRLRTFGLKMF